MPAFKCKACGYKIRAASEPEKCKNCGKSDFKLIKDLFIKIQNNQNSSEFNVEEPKSDLFDILENETMSVIIPGIEKEHTKVELQNFLLPGTIFLSREEDKIKVEVNREDVLNPPKLNGNIEYNDKFLFDIKDTLEIGPIKFKLEEK